MPALTFLSAPTKPNTADGVEYLELLRKITEEVNNSLDKAKSLNKLIKLITPEMADSCAVAVIEGNSIRHLRVAHDLRKNKVSEELIDNYHSEVNKFSAYAEVLRTNKPRIRNHITPEQLITEARDERQAELNMALDFHSTLIYPLRSNNKTVGMLTFVRSKNPNPFNYRELLFASILSGIMVRVIEGM